MDAHVTGFQRNPILYATREGADFVTCWHCQHAYPLQSKFHSSIASDAVWCEKYSCLEDTPHEPRMGADAQCWGISDYSRL